MRMHLPDTDGLDEGQVSGLWLHIVPQLPDQARSVQPRWPKVQLRTERAARVPDNQEQSQSSLQLRLKGSRAITQLLALHEFLPKKHLQRPIFEPGYLKKSRLDQKQCFTTNYKKQRSKSGEIFGPSKL